MRNPLPDPYFRQVQLLRHQGHLDRANELVASCEQIAAAWGCAPYDPVPPLVDLPDGLIVAPAKGGPRHEYL